MVHFKPAKEEQTSAARTIREACQADCDKFNRMSTIQKPEFPIFVTTADTTFHFVHLKYTRLFLKLSCWTHRNTQPPFPHKNTCTKRTTKAHANLLSTHTHTHREGGAVGEMAKLPPNRNFCLLH